jgi:peptide/nickel transport system substrate-binding protein
MKKILFAILAVVLISGLLISSCAKETTTPGPKPGEAKYGGTLRILDMRLPTGALGWPAKTQGQDTYFLQACVEALFRADINLKSIPLLATGYKVADDRSSITLTLRKDVKFHDGTDFNADACKYNLDAVMAAKVPGTTGWSSVEVIDANTVKINIKEWENLIIGNLGGRAGMMVSPTAIKTNGEEWAMTNAVGTGPFKLTKFERDTMLEFSRFDNYWQKGKPYLDKIQYICIPDSVTQITTFKVGDAEMVQPWSGQVLSELKQVPNSVFVYSDSGAFILYPDDANADSPFSKKEVRQALEYAIDKEALMKVSGFGIFLPAYQAPVPLAIGFIKDIPKRTYNPAKAKELLTAAGYPNGFECTLTITIPAPDIKDAQVAIQTFLAAVGIKCNLEYADPAKYADYMAKGWHNTLIYSPAYAAGNFLGSVQTYYTVPGYYVSLKGPANLKELYTAAITAPDVDRNLIDKVTRSMYDDDSLIPISYMGTGQVYQNYVHDLGFGTEFANQMAWTPENAWMSK